MADMNTELSIKAENVVKFYALCNKLKSELRKGWLDWGVKKERLESVAEHIYGVQMLAIAMHSEFGYQLNLEKVLKMLAIHETEEIIIGDLTIFDISREDKASIGHDAIQKVFASLMNKDEYISLILEFDERQSPEAKFAYFCDKLEADLQARTYDLDGCMKKVKLNKNERYRASEDVKKYVDQGLTWGQMWLKFGQQRYDYDVNFLAVSNFAYENDFLNVNIKTKK